MGAGRYDFTIEQGATFSRVVTWKDAAGTPINLTSYTAAMQIRETKDASSAIATSAGISPTITLTLGGAAGTITISISATVTAAFTFETAYYDLELTLSGVVTRLLEGIVTLDKEVTR